MNPEVDVSRVFVPKEGKREGSRRCAHLDALASTRTYEHTDNTPSVHNFNSTSVPER